MGLGSTAKKLQRVADVAEKLYARVNELREEVNSIRETVAETETRVSALEAQAADQRALLEALAEQEGLDVDQVIANARETPPDETAPSDSDDSADDGDPAPGPEGQSSEEGDTVTTAGSDG